MRMKNRLQPVAHRSLPVLARHVAFLAALHWGRREHAYDAVTRILRLVRTGANHANTWLALHIHAQRGIAQREAIFTLRTIIQRQLQHLHSRKHVHTERRLAQLQIVGRARARSGQVVPRPLLGRAAAVEAASRRGRSSAAVSRLELTTVRVQAALPPRAEASRDSVRSAPHPAHGSARTAAASPLVLPADELSRVTEHVLRTLDRRVLSHRERTGSLWE